VTRNGTIATTALVATGLTAVGAALDTGLGTRRLITAMAGATAVGYLAGTFVPRARHFGASAPTRDWDRAFALTFDDGPDPRYTPAISHLLAHRGHRATFFMLARAIRAHPDVARAVLADGHQVASHGDDHRLLAFAAPGELRRQLGAAEDALLTATGTAPGKLFRAPHGVRSPWLTRVVHAEGYRVCAWHGTVNDTARPGTAVIVRRVERLLRPGAVILLHDGDGSGRHESRRQTVEALPAILDKADRIGLRSVTLSNLLV